MSWFARVLAAFVFTCLSLADLYFTRRAIFLGVVEANPVMEMALANSWDVQLKVILTFVTVAAMIAGYRYHAVRLTAWSAVVLMLAVNLYHLWGLSAVAKFR